MMSIWSASALLVSGLGLAPLMLSASQALRWERDSLARGQAVLLAQDLSHRLHLNAVAAVGHRVFAGELGTSRPVAVAHAGGSDAARG